VRQSFQFKLFGCKRLKHLHRTINIAAEIWNHAVALHRRYYRLFKKTLPKARLQAHLARLRNGKMSHWKAVGSQSVQAITDRLYMGWEAFFAGDIKRPPTFRKRRKYRSFTLKQTGYKVIGHGRIRILGRNYRFNQSRPIEGTIKTVTVRRDALADIHITFGSVATLALRRSLAIGSAKLDRHRAEQAENEAVQQNSPPSQRTSARLAFPDHMDRLVACDRTPSSPKRPEMLTRVDPSQRWIAGVDGQSFAAIEYRGVEGWLEHLPLLSP